MKKIYTCAIALLVSFTSVANIKLIEEKGLGWIRCSLIEVYGHEYVVFSNSGCMHSQHHAGCKACTPKPPVVKYQADPSVETDVRTTVTCQMAFCLRDNSVNSGMSIFSVKNCTLEELKRLAEGWGESVDKEKPSKITFHIENSIGCMKSIEEKEVSIEDFMNKIKPKNTKLTNEKWHNEVIKNLENFPSFVPL